MQTKHLIAAFAACLLWTAPGFAIDKSEVREKWHTPFDLYLSAREAYDMKTANPDGVLFIDVRTRQEVHYIGMADQIDAHIPYRFDTTEWKPKSDGERGIFLQQAQDLSVKAVHEGGLPGIFLWMRLFFPPFKRFHSKKSR